MAYTTQPKQAVDSYYRRGGIETLDYLRAKLGDDGFEAYLVGMVHKKIHKAFLTPAAGRDELYAKAAVYMAHLSTLRSGDLPRKTTTERGPRTADLPDEFSRLAVSDATAPDIQHAQSPTLALENSPAPAQQARYGSSYAPRSTQ